MHLEMSFLVATFATLLPRLDISALRISTRLSHIYGGFFERPCWQSPHTLFFYSRHPSLQKFRTKQPAFRCMNIVLRVYNICYQLIILTQQTFISQSL